jgi:hypothetical protein
VGIELVSSRIRWPFGSESSRSRALAGALAPCLFVASVGLSLPQLSKAHSPAVELGFRNALRSLPQNAVVIVHSDIAYYTTGYLQGAVGERRDVVVIMWGQMPSPAYRKRLAQQGIELDTTGRKVSTVDAATQVLAMGRPLFIDRDGAAIARRMPLYPYGVLFRVLPAGEPVPSVAEIFAINRALFDEFDLGYEVPGLDSEYATDMHQQYVQLWSTMARALGNAGLREEQAVANAFAIALAPKR